MALTQPTSVRLTSDLQRAVAAEAKRTEQSKQAVLLSAIRMGLSMFAKKGATK